MKSWSLFRYKRVIPLTLIAHLVLNLRRTKYIIALPSVTPTNVRVVGVEPTLYNIFDFSLLRQVNVALATAC